MVNFSSATPADGSVITGSTYVKVLATDDKGMIKLEWYRDGGLQFTNSMSVPSTSIARGIYIESEDLDAGSHTFTVKIYDTDNNVTEKSIIYIVQ